MGIIAVMAMFIVPAFVACNWMFGSNMMQALSGSGPDRVKYVRGDAQPTPASAAPLSPQQKAAITRAENKAKKESADASE